MKNIYVGNLDFNASEEALRSLFENYGAVERVSLIRDRETGQSRGFGFVEMSDDAEADRAIEALNGANFLRRAITVNEARPREERPPRTSGGGGGGGGFRNSSGGRQGKGGGRREPRW